MKIAVICPIGDLNRFGYWRVAQTCLESWRSVGDLFVIHSSRTAIPFSLRCEYIRTEATLMQMVDGAEWFDHRRVLSNGLTGIEAARKAGYECAVTICVNWYVEQPQALVIAEKCRNMIRCDFGFDFLYRRIQIGVQLFDSDFRSMGLYNLDESKRAGVNLLISKRGLEERGLFAARHDEAYIDCEHELTTAELQEKLADVRNYEDILPKRHGADWAFWERYYRARAATMILSPDPLGVIGRTIAANHPAGAFGDWLIEQMAAVAL